MNCELQGNRVLNDAPHPCNRRRVIFVPSTEVRMSTPGCSPVVTRFDVFEADLRAGELYKAGHRIKLQVLPFQALALLLERPGEIVRREELQKKLWSADTFVTSITASTRQSKSYAKRWATTIRSRVSSRRFRSAATGSS